jgi:hypothetical protein
MWEPRCRLLEDVPDVVHDYESTLAQDVSNHDVPHTSSGAYRRN